MPLLVYECFVGSLPTPIFVACSWYPINAFVAESALYLCNFVDRFLLRPHVNYIYLCVNYYAMLTLEIDLAKSVNTQITTPLLNSDISGSNFIYLAFSFVK